MPELILGSPPHVASDRRARVAVSPDSVRDITRRILGPNGLASTSGLPFKAQQYEYADRIAQCLERGDGAQELASILAISADTGLGKTLGYGVPLLAYSAMGKRSAIATGTLALQHQMLGTPEAPGDLLRAARWLGQLGLDVTIARRMGRQAFTSLGAIDNAIHKLRSEPLTKDDLSALNALRTFAFDANKGLTSGLIEDALELTGGTLPMGLVPVEICLDTDSPKEDHVQYDLHRAEVQRANVVVMTHQYLAVCAKFRLEFFETTIDDDETWGVKVEAPFDALIVDEADRLADSASGVYRNDLSLTRLCSALSGRADAAKALAGVEDLVRTLELVPGNPKALAMVQLPADVREALKRQGPKCADELRSLIKVRKRKARTEGPPSADDRAWLDRMKQAEDVLREAFEISEKATNASAVNFSPVKSLPSISLMPVHPGLILRRLWSSSGKKDEPRTRSPLRSATFTSATLIAPGADPVGGFRDIAHHIGVDKMRVDDDYPRAQNIEADLWGSFQPTEFGKMCIVYCDPSLGPPIQRMEDEYDAEDGEAVFASSPEWLTYCAMAIQKAHEIDSRGNTLVLTRSYENTQEIAALVRERGIEVIEHVRGMTMKEMKKAYLATEGAIWITHAGWEGLDLPGRVQNLVITRIPFQPPDAIYKALLAQMWAISPAVAERIQQAEQMNACKRLLAQAFGRGIRTATDRCRVWVTDPRFPLHDSIGLRLEHSGVKRYPMLHQCVPKRFHADLNGNSTVLLKTGERER